MFGYGWKELHPLYFANLHGERTIFKFYRIDINLN